MKAFRGRIREHNYYENHCEELRKKLLPPDGEDYVEWISVEKNKVYRQKAQQRNKKRKKKSQELSNVEDNEGGYSV